MCVVCGITICVYRRGCRHNQSRFLCMYSVCKCWRSFIKSSSLLVCLESSLIVRLHWRRDRRSMAAWFCFDLLVYFWWSWTPGAAVIQIATNPLLSAQLYLTAPNHPSLHVTGIDRFPSMWIHLWLLLVLLLSLLSSDLLFDLIMCACVYLWVRVWCLFMSCVRTVRLLNDSLQCWHAVSIVESVLLSTENDIIYVYR
jgi:hypothetical protein